MASIDQARIRSSCIDSFKLLSMNFDVDPGAKADTGSSGKDYYDSETE